MVGFLVAKQHGFVPLMRRAKGADPGRSRRSLHGLKGSLMVMSPRPWSEHGRSEGPRPNTQRCVRGGGGGHGLVDAREQIAEPRR